MTTPQAAAIRQAAIEECARRIDEIRGDRLQKRRAVQALLSLRERGR